MVRAHGCSISHCSVKCEGAVPEVLKMVAACNRESLATPSVVVHVEQTLSR